MFSFFLETNRRTRDGSMSSHHLPVAPPGAITMWDGVNWVWQSPSALGYSLISEYGALLESEAQYIDGLDYTSGSMALQRDMFGPVDDYKTKAGALSVCGERADLTWTRPCLILFIEARHADEIVVLNYSTGAKPIHMFSPNRYQKDQNQQWTSGSPLVCLNGSFRVMTFTDETSGPMYNDDPTNIVWRNMYYNNGSNPVYLAWYTSYNRTTWTQYSGGNAHLYIYFCAMTGYRTSKPIPLKDLSLKPDGLRVAWDGVGDIAMDLFISYDGGTTYPAQVLDLMNGDVVPGIYLGDDLTDVVVQTKIKMTAHEGDPLLPALTSYDLHVLKYHSDKHGDDAIDQLYAISSGSPAVALPGMIWVAP